MCGLAALTTTGLVAPSAVDAQSSGAIRGEGSSWSANAIDAMRVNARQFGITVDYNPSGSTAGRRNFLNGTVDFAVSDIPFQFEPEDGSAPERPAPDSYAYIPATAGGLAFMYNLQINGRRVTNLRLSGENVVKIFTGAITDWNDPAIAADNPGLDMPDERIVPVVRSDGAGASLYFTQWMIAQHKGLWDDYCARSGRAPRCGSTSFYPTISGMIAQAGDLGVAGYVSQGFAEGAIGYVNYSYALGVQFPVAKVLNAAGFYTEPTPDNVAVSLLQARINTDRSDPAVYLTQDLSRVYADTDPRNYQLSSYSYFILPTKVQGQFNEAKGRTLGAFAYYAMCQAQQQSASLGYSPLPINLVEASLEQIRLIPGVEVQDINIQSCRNPTFSPDGTNVLARDAPQPQACDRQGQSQCPNGTGGLANVPTPVTSPTDGGGEPTDGVRATFSVVAPEGPCLIVRGGDVAFGSIVAGARTAATGDASTVVESCTDLTQQVSVDVGDASSVEPGGLVLSAQRCGVDLGDTDATLRCPASTGASSFGYGSRFVGGPEPTSVFRIDDDALVDSSRPELPPRSSLTFDHYLQPPGVGTPAVEFAFEITYTAATTSVP